jgi:hypothetical protein
MWSQWSWEVTEEKALWTERPFEAQYFLPRKSNFGLLTQVLVNMYKFDLFFGLQRVNAMEDLVYPVLWIPIGFSVDPDPDPGISKIVTVFSWKAI